MNILDRQGFELGSGPDQLPALAPDIFVFRPAGNWDRTASKGNRTSRYRDRTAWLEIHTLTVLISGKVV